MRRFGTFFALLAVISLTGCFSDEYEQPAVTEENGKFKLSANVVEAVPASQTQKTQKQTPPPQTQRTAKREPAPKRKPAARRPAQPPTGAIDGSLNDVERSYVQDVRRNHQQQTRQNEQKVFGGFSVEGLFSAQ